MAFDSTVASLDSLVAEVVIPTSTTAAKVVDLAAAANQAAGGPLVLPSQIREYNLTNNDPTNAVYIGYTNAVSGTRYYRTLAANGGSHQIAANVGVLRKLWIVAAAGNPNVTLAVYS